MEDSHRRRKFNRWLMCICVVEFDLEVGQSMKECYPQGVLSNEEVSDISFSAFPDSISGLPSKTSVQDSVFHFRVKRRGIVPDSALKSTASPQPFIYGYVFCRQRQDARLKRGGDQQSVIILSHQPYSTVFKPLVKVAGPLYFNVRAKSALRRLAVQVSEWPTPEPGAICELTVGEVVIRTQLPLNSQLPPPADDEADDWSSHCVSFLPLCHHPDRSLAGSLASTPPLTPSSATFSRSPQRSFDESHMSTPMTAPPLLMPPSASALHQTRTSRSNSRHSQFEANRAAEQIWAVSEHSSYSGSFTELQAPGTASSVGQDPMHESTSDGDLVGQSAEVPHSPFEDTDLFGIFKGVLPNLWTLWELVILGEPLMVVAPNPTESSEAVTALLSLIAPLPSGVDFRPYFTIHDPMFSQLATSKPDDRLPNILIGVTNLFFLKAIQHWPNVLSVGIPPNSKTSPTPVTRRSLSNTNIASASTSTPASKSFSSRIRDMGAAPMRALRSARFRSKGPQQLLQEHTQTLWTTRETIATRPDIDMLNSLVDVDAMTPGSQEYMLACAVNTAQLRRHFAELTANFLAPFGAYVRGNLPQPGRCPFASPPSLRPFHAADFLLELEEEGLGPFLKRRLRQNWLDLYRSFLRTQTFNSWFQRKRAAAQRAQQRAWRQARAVTDIQPFLSDLSEVSLVDAFNVVEAQLIAEQEIVEHNSKGREGLSGKVFSNLQAHERTAITNKLRRDLWAIYGVLPRDVQQTFSFNPQRAAVLRGLMAQAQLRVPGHLERVYSVQPDHPDHPDHHRQNRSPAYGGRRSRRKSESHRKSGDWAAPAEARFSASWSHSNPDGTKLGDLLKDARHRVSKISEDESGTDHDLTPIQSPNKQAESPGTRQTTLEEPPIEPIPTRNAQNESLVERMATITQLI